MVTTLGEYSRRPKGLEESWKVGQVGRGTEAEPHEQLPDTPSPEAHTPARADRCLVQGSCLRAFTAPSGDPGVTVPITLTLSLVDPCPSVLFRTMVTFLQDYCSSLLTGLPPLQEPLQGLYTQVSSLPTHPNPPKNLQGPKSQTELHLSPTASLLLHSAGHMCLSAASCAPCSLSSTYILCQTSPLHHFLPPLPA